MKNKKADSLSNFNEIERRVLIVDDDKDFAESIADILTSHGYAVELAQNTAQAEQLFVKYDAQVALIDIRLGHDSGVKLIPKLKDVKPDILCVIITAYASIETSIEALEKGAHNYLRKPFPPEELLLVLERCYEKIHMLQEKAVMEKQLTMLSTAINHAAEAIIITDANGVIQHINPACKTITGYSSEEMLGKNPKMLKSGKHDKSFYETMWNTIISGKVWRGHVINKRKDGSLYELDVTISPILNEHGKVVSFVRVGRDVTHEVMLEKQLRQAQKMEAIGTLAGGIAHDFNNILTSILGYTEMALAETPERSDSQGYLQQVFKACERSKNLVKQILTFSRNIEQERKPMQPYIIVKESLKFLRSSLPSTIKIRENIDKNAGTVLADPTQISQVLMNLCANAEYAMRGRKDGILEVSLNAIEVDEEIASTSIDLQIGSYIIITVSDTGVGIDNKTVERIFDPFFTTKPVGEGSGLGLASAHGIIKSYGGTITVKSEPGKWTTFQLYLPRIGKSTEDKLEKLAPIPGGRASILFVEDEDAIAEMGKKMLEQLGYSVDIKKNGKEALEIFRSNSGRFDLIITDQTMPEMTGLELIEGAKAINPNIPVILMTGHGVITKQERFKAIGVDKFIMKPFTRREMAEVTRKVLDKKDAS